MKKYVKFLSLLTIVISMGCHSKNISNKKNEPESFRSISDRKIVAEFVLPSEDWKLNKSSFGNECELINDSAEIDLRNNEVAFEGGVRKGQYIRPLGYGNRTIFFKTNPQKFPILSHTSYEVSFDYEILEELNEDNEFYVAIQGDTTAIRTSGMGWTLPLSLFEWSGKQGQKSTLKAHFGVHPNQLDGEVRTNILTNIIAQADTQIVFGIKSNHYAPIEKGRIRISNLSIKSRFPKDFDKVEMSPEIISPQKDQKITPEATHFQWKSVNKAQTYEIQFSEDQGFSNSKSEITSDVGINIASYIPEKWSQEGNIFWRVRGRSYSGNAGPWSSSSQFEVASLKKEFPLASQIGVQSPRYLYFHDGPHPRFKPSVLLKDIPKEIRPEIAFEVAVKGNFSGLDTIRSAVEGWEKLRLAGEEIPDVYFLVRWNNDTYGSVLNTTSLADLEWVFQQNYPWVKGAVVLEQHIEIDAFARLYIPRVMALCHHYGKHLVWSEFGPQSTVLESYNSEIFEAMKKYGSNITLAHKWNNPWAPFMHHNFNFACQLAGLAKIPGVSPEAWLWLTTLTGHLGVDPNEGMGKYKEWQEYYREFPPTFWGYQMLLGLGQGSVLYRMEGSNFMDEEKAGYKSHHFTSKMEMADNLKNVVLPIMRDIHQYKIIPTEEEILQQVPLVTYTKTSYSNYDFATPYTKEGSYGAFLNFVDHVWGVRHGAESIPDKGRYYLPILFGENSPEVAKRISDRVEKVDLGNLTHLNPVFEKIDSKMPPLEKGEALVVNWDRAAFVLNTEENRSRPQNFHLKFSNNFELTGMIQVHQYFLIIQTPEGIKIHINQRDEHGADFTVKSPNEVSVVSLTNQKIEKIKKDSGTQFKINKNCGRIELLIHKAQ